MKREVATITNPVFYIKNHKDRVKVEIDIATPLHRLSTDGILPSYPFYVWIEYIVWGVVIGYGLSKQMPENYLYKAEYYDIKVIHELKTT